jgi:transcriptional regulator with XRE-family HTH domain
MPIKQPEVLSRADFDEAVVKLRLNVSEIAKETGIPRTYLSEYRNGDRKLRPEHQGKLRDYFESKGVEFSDEPANRDHPEVDAPVPHEGLAVGTVCYFPIRGDLTPTRVREVMSEIERNDTRARELLSNKVKRKTTFLLNEPDGFEKVTEEEIRELFALFSANYVWFRYLTGVNNPLASRPEKNTLQEVLLETLQESVSRAGLTLDAVAAESVPADADEVQA